MEAFIQSLTSEQQKQYEELSDAFMEQWGLDNQDCFMIGFKIAVRIFLEAIIDLSEKLQFKE